MLINMIFYKRVKKKTDIIIIRSIWKKNEKKKNNKMSHYISTILYYTQNHCNK